jgi:two-component system, OmpR family, KDP operon response regulator KdpE
MVEGSRGRVLLVDDEDDLRTLIADLLREAGYAVDSARDGVEALGIVERAMPDLILLDIKMPVMDGRRFAVELSARYPERPPIVVVTATDSGPTRALETGAEGWVGKPFDIDRLLGMVERYVRRH